MLLRKTDEDKVKSAEPFLKTILGSNATVTVDAVRYDKLLRIFSEQLNLSTANLDKSLKKLRTEEVSLNILLNKYRNCVYNSDFIKEGLAIPEWTGEHIDAHIFCRYVSYVAPNPNKKQRAGLAVNFYCMDGLLAGVTTTTIVPISFVQTILRKYAGIPRTSEINYKELVGCLLKTKLAKVNGKTRITELTVDTAVRTNNKNLYKSRRDVRRCKTPGVPCAVCKKTKKECRLACQ